MKMTTITDTIMLNEKEINQITEATLYKRKTSFISGADIQTLIKRGWKNSDLENLPPDVIKLLF
jgi:hypothetical protein